MAAPMAELPVEPQSLRKLSLNSLKRGLDLFSPLMVLPSLSTHKAKGFESAIRWQLSMDGLKIFRVKTTDKSKHKTEQASTPLALPGIPEAKGSKKDGGQGALVMAPLMLPKAPELAMSSKSSAVCAWLLR